MYDAWMLLLDVWQRVCIVTCTVFQAKKQSVYFSYFAWFFFNMQIRNNQDGFTDWKLIKK